MQDTIQGRILDALLLALRPIARALLRAGIGYREFDEIAKTAFVDIATRDYGLRGRPTNISRVAVMTGLTRKEVRRLRDKTEAGQGATVIRATPMATILHKWYTENEFLDNSGAPADLKFDGPGVTFSGLVKKYGGDIPPGAMRTELKRINAVEETESGNLKVLKRNVSGLDVHEKLIAGLAHVLYPAAVTIAHNTSQKSDTWIQRIVFTESVREADLTRLKRISSDRLVEFTESIDDLFVAYEALHESDISADSGRSVGIGVFYFEQDIVNVEQASVA
ncbi:MAG: DUF6502 family protein [Woeseia sp.]